MQLFSTTADESLYKLCFIIKISKIMIIEDIYYLCV